VQHLGYIVIAPLPYSAVLMRGCIGNYRRTGFYSLNVIIFDVSLIANILVLEHRYIVGEGSADDMRQQLFFEDNPCTF